jgi:hypothetical protein
VPEDVVRRHLEELHRALDGGDLGNEGFAAVVRLRDPVAVAAVRFERVPGPVSRG